MKTILLILLIIVFFSYMSQRSSLNYQNWNPNIDGRKKIDIYLICVIIFMSLMAGLRLSYNDTEAYIIGFQNSETIKAFLSNPENLTLTSNPLFYGIQSLVHTFTNNVNTFFLLCGFFQNILIVRFIKRHSRIDCFVYSMLLYVCLGMFMFSLAAQKQILAMAILTLALEKLFEKKYVTYYLIVIVAGLVHTYAFLFLFLPLFGKEIWNFRTYLLVFLTVFIMYTFQNSIETLLEIADQIGKGIDEASVFGSGMNIFRVLVYGVVPVTSFLFKKRLSHLLNYEECVFVQMTILSFMFMLLGSINGANMFGRSGYYFSLGYICILPNLIKQLFNDQSAKIVLFITCISFILFFCYDASGFNYSYRYKRLIEYIGEVI